MNMILISRLKNTVKECIITDNGILCLERNLLNDYMLGYVAFRLVELITCDICTNINILKNSNNISNLIEF